MEFKEFNDNVLGNTINIGDEVWICDYRFETVANKPIRHVVPQKVVIEDNSNLPANKKIYYSSIHFLPLGKNGKPKKQVIAPFDNTGYRGYTGVSLQIFATEKECREAYVRQCKSIEAKILSARAATIARFDAMEQGIADEIKNHG